MRPVLLTFLLALVGCGAAVPPDGVPPESDAGVVLDEQRNAIVAVDGRLVQVTDLPGAEELEVVSPDGTWVAFVSDTTGLASVWAVRVPAEGKTRHTPVQLTNVGVEKQKRVPGQAPAGFVPVPETDGGLRWADEHTVTWTAQGRTFSAEVPR